VEHRNLWRPVVDCRKLANIMVVIGSTVRKLQLNIVPVHLLSASKIERLERTVGRFEEPPISYM